MPQYNFSKIAEITGVEPAIQSGDPVVEFLLTDSRKLLNPSRTIFFAIDSENKSASAFVEQLNESGVHCFVVGRNNNLVLSKLKDACVIVCDDVLKALQDVASYHRSQFNIPVIGITGSNGKTIVKEWLSQMLYADHNIVRSPKSYNSQIGVPLSVWEMNSTHTLGIFEAGISLPDEMKHLERIIRPSIGIFTYIGEAHASGFDSVHHKIREKLELFRNADTLIYCADDQDLKKEIINFSNALSKAPQFISWGKGAENDLVVNNIEKSHEGASVSCSWKGEPILFIIPLADDASVHNAITCCTVLLHLNITIASIQNSLKQLRPVHMRLELRQAMNHCSLINDSYSSDLNSLFIALDFLQQQQQHPKKTVILSDIPQTGKDPQELYSLIVNVLKQKKISRLIGIGPDIYRHQDIFSDMPEFEVFSSTDAFMVSFPSMKFKDEAILLKGARAFHFERINNALEQKRHETILEIDLAAVHHNLKYYRSLIKPGTKMMAMVKASSYGSGIFEIANVMSHAGVDYLAVAYADEGVELRNAGVRLPVMVMNTEEAGFDNLVRYNLEPEIYSFKILHSFISFLEERDQAAFPVHIKLDTGMHRLGFSEEEIPLLANVLNAGFIKVMSVFSHLAASGDPDFDDFTKQQDESFIKSAAILENTLGYKFLKHIANTSAIHRHPHLQYDMVRLGIGLYGIDSNQAIQKNLKPVTSLRTTISQLKNLTVGDSVGYNRSSILDGDTTVATVRIGYADGYPRSLSNGVGKMLVNGRLAPVIGNVCMDMTMLDVTGIDVKEGDEVTVFGNGLNVWDVAASAGTIPYEILTGISQRVRRIYFEE